MAQVINRYRADLRDFRFLLFEQFDLPSVLGRGPYEEWGIDEIKMVLDQAYRFVCEVLGPLNASGDAQGCRVEKGRVITPDGFKEAWRKFYEAGWRSVTLESGWGGQDAPIVVRHAIEELFCGANSAFNLFTALTLSGTELLMQFATEEQKKRYVGDILSGRFSVAMCATEPHAGSDVGEIRTSAKARGDGTYEIKGSKIFITGGDSDLVENVVHLVLARIEGAEAGTKGLSLFIVPRVRLNEDGSLGEQNDVEVAAIEQKMGIKGSATCAMQFGDHDDCIGELVGGVEHQGIRQIFHIMNTARIGVGTQGLAVAAHSYLCALEYARERKQGASVTRFKDANAPRVAIIEHPNIRRDLLSMKARVEGIRALVTKLSMHMDRVRVSASEHGEMERAYHQGQVDLLTPLVKASGTDAGFEVSSRAIQIYGGAGYLRDHPVEQNCRDAKIFQIYEGTNFIQALDLVSRKLAQASGANTQALLSDIQRFIDEKRKHRVLGEAIEELQVAHEAVSGVAGKLVDWTRSGKLERLPLVAEDFLTLLSDLVVGWLLLDQAVIALEKLPELPENHQDRDFYAGKRYAALHFSVERVSTIRGRARRLSAINALPIEIPTEAFATV